MTRRIIGLVVLALAFSTCSVPLEESATVIPDEQLPDVLRGTTTSVPGTSIPATGTRTVVYYLVALPEQGPKILQATTRDVEDTDSLTDFLVIAFSEDFRVEDERETLSNSLENWILDRVERAENLAEISIRPLDAENPPGAEILKDTAAQLVWTLTEFEAIDRVRILIDGERVSLPTTGEADTEEGQPVTRDDYALYDPERPPPETTTTSTTSTTTTTTTTTTTPPSTATPPA